MNETISISGKLTKTEYGLPIVAGIELYTLFEAFPAGASVNLYITRDPAAEQEAEK